MAFCKQCGSDLNGAKFCPNCGASAEGEMAYAGAPVGADVRQRSLADMEHMINYFGAKKAQYDEFDSVSAEVEERTIRGFGGWIGAAVISVIIGLFCNSAFFYIAAVAFVAAFILLKKKNKEKLTSATARRDELGNELAEYYADYGYCSVGLEYTKPAILSVLYDLVRKGRASNPGDAINIYLADLRDEENMKKQQELIDETKQLKKEMKKTRRYAAADFWLKK